MNTLKIFHCCILALLLFSACSKEEQNSLETYYFPLEELTDGMVYEYEGVDPMDPPFYWYFRTLEQAEGTYLTSMYYNHQYIPYQLMTEERVENGMLLDQFFLYETDTSTGKQIQVPVTIEAGNLFPFEAEPQKTVLFYKVNWTLPSDTTLKTTLTRNRQFLGDTTYTYKGETYPALKFYTRELIDLEQEGHFEYEYEGLEIYAKGLGLVYFRKEVTDEFTTEYRLKDRYPMEKLEQKFSEYYNQPQATLPVPE